MNIPRLTKLLATSALAIGLILSSVSPWASIDPYPQLSETALDLVDKLENRHYSKRKFDDELSSMLLDNYLKSLDPSRAFFYQSDVDAFEAYRYLLDDQISNGELSAGFAIFNRYQERIEQRLDKLLAELPELVAGMDFSVDEELSLETEKRSWPRNEAEADERWRKQIKNSVLSLRLASKAKEEMLNRSLNGGG